MWSKTAIASLDEWFPPCGPCGFCRRGDKRHRIWDTMLERHAAGDTAEMMAEDYMVPEVAVRAVLSVRPYHRGGTLPVR